MDIVERIQSQQRLLNAALTRTNLADLAANLVVSSDLKEVVVRVWRNYAAEPMESAATVAANYWGFRIAFEYMGYDDGFTFAEWEPRGEPCIDLILVDRQQYHLDDEAFSAFIAQRTDFLRQLNGADPIVVVVTDQIDMYVASRLVDSITAEALGTHVSDERLLKITGSRLSPAAHNQVGRHLACTWVAERLVPPRKVIAVDLDNTLHRGILGEVGLKVVVDESARRLQLELKEARQSGYLLAILSKNDERDVLALLENHPDYLLGAEDFVAIFANWNPKAMGMQMLLEKTRVAPNSIVFVDDNEAELIQMHAVYPDIALVLAGEDVEAERTLRLVPGFRRSSVDDLGDIRTRDLVSNEARETLIQQGLANYYRTARPTLTIYDNTVEHRERLVDLGKRSNQFNLLLNRFSNVDYARPNKTAVALEMSDRFSSSGIIGGILLEYGPDRDCRLIELFLSCRILGRRLETLLIASGLARAMDRLQVSQLKVSWVVGERNQPALEWLGSELLENEVVSGGEAVLELDTIKRKAIVPEGVAVEFA